MKTKPCFRIACPQYVLHVLVVATLEFLEAPGGAGRPQWPITQPLKPASLSPGGFSSANVLSESLAFTALSTKTCFSFTKSDENL